LELRPLERPVVDTGREHDRAAGDLASVARDDDVPVDARAQLDGLAHAKEARTEGPRLLVRLECQVGAAYPAREAEVVADQRARPGLAAHRLALDDEHRQPL